MNEFENNLVNCSAANCFLLNTRIQLYILRFGHYVGTVDQGTVFMQILVQQYVALLTQVPAKSKLFKNKIVKGQNRIEHQQCQYSRVAKHQLNLSRIINSKFFASSFFEWIINKNAGEYVSRKPIQFYRASAGLIHIDQKVSKKSLILH